MYAMTQRARSGRGQAVALDLVRAELRAENMMTAIRHNEAMRARLSEDFGGYLVTDENPCDLTEAEMAACWPFGDPAEFERFSGLRDRHSWGLDGLCTTGGGFSWSVGVGEAIDAPDLLAAGGMWRFDPEPFGYPSPAQLYAVRGGK